MNKYKNESIIKLGEVEILLRPDFENLSSFEGNVITLDELSIRMMKGKVIPLTTLVQAIYYFQAERDHLGKRRFNLEEINVMVQNTTGIAITADVMKFVSSCIAGHTNKKDTDAEVDKNLADAEKKS
jgi:hypothetical protein